MIRGNQIIEIDPLDSNDFINCNIFQEDIRNLIIIDIYIL